MADADTRQEWGMRLIVAICATLMLAGAAHARDVADFTGNSHWVFFPYWKFGTECEYRWRSSQKIILVIFFGQSKCPKVHELPKPVRERPTEK
jgi:hypothetical protein